MYKNLEQSFQSYKLFPPCDDIEGMKQLRDLLKCLFAINQSINQSIPNMLVWSMQDFQLRTQKFGVRIDPERQSQS